MNKLLRIYHKPLITFYTQTACELETTTKNAVLYYWVNINRFRALGQVGADGFISGPYFHQQIVTFKQEFK